MYIQIKNKEIRKITYRESQWYYIFFGWVISHQHFNPYPAGTESDQTLPPV